jgi:hypothetical protein
MIDKEYDNEEMKYSIMKLLRIADVSNSGVGEDVQRTACNLLLEGTNPSFSLRAIMLDIYNEKKLSDTQMALLHAILLLGGVTREVGV